MYIPQCRKRILIHALTLFTDNEVPEDWKSYPKDHPPLKSAHKQPADRANKPQVPDGTPEILFENVSSVGFALLFTGLVLILSSVFKNKNYGEGTKNKPGFPKQPDWFLDARGFANIEKGLKKVGFSDIETHGILGNNWYNFYKSI